MDIKGKVAIVTGSSSISGVGGETAKLLASRGCKVAVNYADNRSGADETVAACVAAGATHSPSRPMWRTTWIASV
jgi:3-oxoacyl-[acyl-carrier protein] reductase